MANTMTLIASSTVGATAVSSVTFSSIPATYTDLLIKVSARSTDIGNNYDNYYLTINGTASGTAYSDKILYGVGSSTGSFGHSGVSQMQIGATPNTAGTASTFSNDDIYIPNYLSSNYKSASAETVVERNTTTNGATFTALVAGLWSSTSTITSLVLTPDATTWVQYSSVYLYGIKNS
jgi:hypothetical protein